MTPIIFVRPIVARTERYAGESFRMRHRVDIYSRKV
jgi:hypothetical protein